MTDQEPLKIKQWHEDNIELVDSPVAVGNVYSNNVRIGFTNWDMFVLFNEILGEKDGKLMVMPKARVVMSLQHAKAFLQAFQDSLSKFEADFGEVQVLERLQPPKS